MTKQNWPTDEELLELAQELDDVPVRAPFAFARAVLARFMPSAAAPVSVADRLPDLTDCAYRNGDFWCWGQERSVLTGHGTARWTLMRISRIKEEAVAWLPHYALPLP